MDLVDGPANRDIMVVSSDVRVVIDPKSALFVSGSLLDYSDELQKGGFKPEALAVKIAGNHIGEVTRLSVSCTSSELPSISRKRTISEVMSRRRWRSPMVMRNRPGQGEGTLRTLSLKNSSPMCVLPKLFP